MTTTLGQRLRMLREFHKLSQVNFAKTAKIPRSTVSEAENDIHKPSADKLAAIGRAFGVKLEWLLYGEGEMYPTADSADIPQPSAEIQEKVITEGGELIRLMAIKLGLSLPEMNDLIDRLRNSDNPEEARKELMRKLLG